MLSTTGTAAKLHRLHTAGFRMWKEGFLPCFGGKFSAAELYGKLPLGRSVESVAAVFLEPAGKFFIHGMIRSLQD